MWLAGHQAWCEEGTFDEAKYGLDTNPYPDGSSDHRAWGDGWSTALEDYIAVTSGEFEETS